MKIINAFDSFKGCISASMACSAASSGLLLSHPDIDVISMPVSDGGEGFVECIVSSLPVVERRVAVHGPLMEKVMASYAVSNDGSTAYMEVASACGLTLVPEGMRNPELTSTYGVGEMIRDAVDIGVGTIYVGLGGSSTCDGGEGIVQCFGDNVPHGVKVYAVCDVTAPLYGPEGAAYVFAPQKGASPEQVKRLDLRLRQFARRTESAGIADRSLADCPGAGAAGGIGYALMAYLGATFKSGIDTVLDIIGFDDAIGSADAVLTGEGCSDRQTLMGKVPSGILKRCRAAGIPVHLMSGCIKDSDALEAAGFASVRSINQNDSRPTEVLMRPEIAMANLARCAAGLVIK